MMRRDLLESDLRADAEAPELQGADHFDASSEKDTEDVQIASLGFGFLKPTLCSQLFR